VIEKEPDRVGASVATAMGGLKSFEDCCDTLTERGPDRVNPVSLLAIIPNMGAAWVSIQLGTRGPLASPCTACAASQMAIGDGLDAIRLGRADVMLCGGTDAAITRAGIAGFSAMRALSRRNEDRRGGKSAVRRRPRRVRDGRGGRDPGARGARAREEARGEDLRGAARLRRLLRRQALTEPDPTGQHPARAMKMAFADAGINPDEIDYINAHGTSTPLGDASETRVIKRALGEDNARKTPISSTKGATGHCLGAAGGVEAIFCALAIHEGVLPPRITYDTPDPERDLDYIPNEAREADIRIAVSNSFGFGGHNACLVLRRFEG
jgi:3-oxoacyl-[acyl-carrier-protein] synthase II